MRNETKNLMERPVSRSGIIFVPVTSPHSFKNGSEGTLITGPTQDRLQIILNPCDSLPFGRALAFVYANAQMSKKNMLSFLSISFFNEESAFFRVTFAYFMRKAAIRDAGLITA